MSIELVLLPIAIAAIGTMKNWKQAQEQSEEFFYLETRMTNAGILREALTNCGCQSVSAEKSVNSSIAGAQITFEPGEEGVFYAGFFGVIPIPQAEKFIDDLHTEYTRLVQQDVYVKLLERAASKGLFLDSEEIQQDGSILLTLRITE
jgi:hypothetical protein